MPATSIEGLIPESAQYSAKLQEAHKAVEVRVYI